MTDVAPPRKSVEDVMALVAQAEREIRAKEERIAELESEVEALQQDVESLEEWVDDTTRIFNLPRSGTPVSAERAAAPRGGGPRPSKANPLWSGALEVLTELKRPMTVRDVAGVLAKRGWTLHRKYGRETVRMAMLRRPDLFEQVGGSRWYALAAWPDAQKAPPAEEGGPSDVE